MFRNTAPILTDPPRSGKWAGEAHLPSAPGGPASANVGEPGPTELGSLRPDGHTRPTSRRGSTVRTLSTPGRCSGRSRRAGVSCQFAGRAALRGLRPHLYPLFLRPLLPEPPLALVSVHLLSGPRNHLRICEDGV